MDDDETKRGVGGGSPANVMEHLGGIDFPANKEEIVDHAKHGRGPDTPNVVMVLEKLPDKEYGGPQEILKEIGDIE